MSSINGMSFNISVNNIQTNTIVIIVVTLFSRRYTLHIS